MKKIYELMDVDTANVVGFYDTLDDALAIVRTALVEYGPAGIQDLALSEKDTNGHIVMLFEGSDLEAMAQRPLEPATRG